MKIKTNLCMSCMRELDENGVCRVCGKFDESSCISSYLAPRTFLAQRYIIGRLMSYNGESALYMGFDTEENRKVTVREYMPDTLCVRERDEESVTVKPDKLPLYKTYLAEFTDLHTTLMNSPDIHCVQPVLNVFSANNTAYAVMEHISGITLKAYLDNCGGTISWENVRELFPPLLTALSMLHGLGIIHRGISTSTVFVSERNALCLTGFSISAAHTVDSEIGYEVYSGYAPPEQYSSARRNGTWTDVYGVSAVLYRCLTGTTPPAAPERLIGDEMVDPMIINRNIPKHVSDVIVKGMSLEPQDRISTITEFVDRLFKQSVSVRSREVSAEIPIPSKKERAAVGKASSKRSSSKPKKSRAEKEKIKFIAAASVIGSIVLVFLLAIIIPAVQDSGSEPEVTTGVSSFASVTSASSAAVSESDSLSESAAPSEERYIVPDFTGSLFETVSTSSRYSYLIFTPIYEFSSEYGIGQIISQDIAESTAVVKGTSISVTVSKGPETVELPDYEGKTASDYIQELASLGIKYRVEEEESDELDEGVVVRCSVEAGAAVNVAQGEEIVVYSAVKPPDTATEETAPETESSSDPSNESSSPDEPLTAAINSDRDSAEETPFIDFETAASE